MLHVPCCTLPAHTAQHVEAWSKMLAGSSPPIASTPITPFLDEHAFRSECELLNASCVSPVTCHRGSVKGITDASSPTHRRPRTC
jgi:hypothetical protein